MTRSFLVMYKLSPYDGGTPSISSSIIEENNMTSATPTVKMIQGWSAKIGASGYYTVLSFTELSN